MSGVNYMTQESYDKLYAELDVLKTTKRDEIAKAIAKAREMGDLSENAEYDAAKDAQGMLELKINELELSLANTRILDTSQIDTSKVTVLSKVKIQNLKNNREVTYHLVSESESDIANKKVSVNSPIGKGLLGHKEGEIADIETPGGIMQFKILEISI